MSLDLRELRQRFKEEVECMEVEYGLVDELVKKILNTGTGMGIGAGRGIGIGIGETSETASRENITSRTGDKLRDSFNMAGIQNLPRATTSITVSGSDGSTGGSGSGVNESEIGGVPESIKTTGVTSADASDISICPHSINAIGTAKLSGITMPDDATVTDETLADTSTGHTRPDCVHGSDNLPSGTPKSVESSRSISASGGIHNSSGQAGESAGSKIPLASGNHRIDPVGETGMKRAIEPVSDDSSEFDRLDTVNTSIDTTSSTTSETNSASKNTTGDRVFNPSQSNISNAASQTALGVADISAPGIYTRASTNGNANSRIATEVGCKSSKFSTTIVGTGDGNTDINLILLIISNILLVNRKLKQNYFKEIYSQDLLQFLIKYVFQLVPENTYNQFITQKKSLTEKISTKINDTLGKIASNLKRNALNNRNIDERRLSKDEREKLFDKLERPKNLDRKSFDGNIDDNSKLRRLSTEKFSKFEKLSTIDDVSTTNFKDKNFDKIPGKTLDVFSVKDKSNQLNDLNKDDLSSKETIVDKVVQNDDSFIKSTTPTLNVSKSNNSQQSSTNSNTPSTITVESKSKEDLKAINLSKDATLNSNNQVNYNNSNLLNKSESPSVEYFSSKKLETGAKPESSNTYASILKATSNLNIQSTQSNMQSSMKKFPPPLIKSSSSSNSKNQSPITSKFPSTVSMSDTNLFSKFTNNTPKQLDRTGSNLSSIDPIACALGSSLPNSNLSNPCLKVENTSEPELRFRNTDETINTLNTKGSALSLHSRNSRDTADSDNSLHDVNFESLIPIYRLIFLILYDEVNELDELVLENTDKALIKGLNYCLNDSFDPNDLNYFENLSMNQKKSSSSVLIQADIEYNDHYNMQNHVLTNCHPQDQYHILATIEILKGLYSFYHKHPEYIKSGIISLPYLMRSVISLNNTSLLIDSNQHLLLNNLINVITIILTNSGNVEYYNLPIYQVFSQNLMKLVHHRLMNYLDDKEIEINDISSLFILITYLTKEFRRHTCRFALKIFQKNMIPTESDNIPIIYTQCLQLLTRRSGSLDSRQVIKDQMTLSKLKHLIYECFFELSWKPTKSEHYKKFLECVGYLNAKTYVLNNRSDIPSVIGVGQYQQPLYFTVDTSVTENEKLTNPLAINESFKDILKNHNENPTTSDMTEEEKVAEAEKLYVIFDRMEKTGVFQDFKNPIREWQQSGRFEDLDDPPNDT